MSIKKFEHLASENTPYVGVDEVGRGCLAGPVVAGAVVFLSDKNNDLFVDSKSISEKKRSDIAKLIHADHLVGLGWASVEEIDQVNILQATFIAMKRAVSELTIKAKEHKIDITKGMIYIDGRDKIPGLGSIQQRAVIKGDQLLRVISAASIVAKVARDEFMVQLEKEIVEENRNTKSLIVASEKEWGFGFDQHKGYGTAFHRHQIQKLGPTKWHRRTFGGVKEYFS